MTNLSSASSTCPERPVLSDLALGKLPVGEIDRLATHIDTCTTCQRILETLEGIDDSIVADLREPACWSQPADPDLESRIRQAEAIPADISFSKPEPSLPPPEQIGPYQLLCPLGAGGMGTVWKAIHGHLKRPVAVKVLRTARHQSADARARFYREMEAIGRLDHPNLVRAHDAGIADDRDFLVMELLDGVDGRRLVTEHGPLPVADACEIIRETALGLQYAHEKGLVHRDVKPSNLMVTHAGQVKVLDLGLARFHDAAPDVDDRTEEGKIVGTADYIAPEQIEDTRQADARADIYSLGCTLYFLLAGRPPFSGSSYDTLGKKLIAHSRQPFPAIHSARSDLPKGLESILDRMVAKAPSDRFQTASEVANALALFCDGADLAGLDKRLPVRRSQAKSAARRVGPWLAAVVAVTFLSVAAAYGEFLLLWVQDEGLLVAQGPEATVVLVGDQANHTVTIPTNVGGIRLSSGRYEVELAGDNSKLSASPGIITIHRGGKASIQIRHIASEAASAGMSQASDSPQEQAAIPLAEQVTNSIGMPLRLIPAGEFQMGSPEAEVDREWSESPQHRVVISRPFYIGQFEVTQAEYEKVMGHNPSRFSSSGEIAHLLHDVDTQTFPVESVRWPDAVEFCKRLSDLPAEQEAGRVYRLPTEGEWEYACRAGTTTPFHHGSTLAPGDANFKTNFPYGDAEPIPFLGRPMPVGSFAANPWGLHDMHGNVWEWTSDWFDPGYYHRAPLTNPTGPESGEYHVLRGGGWGGSGKWCRSAHRASEEKAPRMFYSIGFRVVCELKD